jgi:hypothetical protein
MFFGRKPAPEPMPTLASLDRRLRVVEALLAVKHSNVEVSRAAATLEGALKSYAEARDVDRAKRGVTD